MQQFAGQAPATRPSSPATAPSLLSPRKAHVHKSPSARRRRVLLAKALPNVIPAKVGIHGKQRILNAWILGFAEITTNRSNMALDFMDGFYTYTHYEPLGPHPTITSTSTIVSLKKPDL